MACRAACFAPLLGIATLLAISAAHAEDNPSARLEFANLSSARGCPDEHEFRDRVAARLGLDPFEESAGRTVVATVRDDKQKLLGEVAIRGPEGTILGRRQLSAPRGECAELMESLASLVSLLLDPLGRATTRAVSASAPPAAAATGPAALPETLRPPPPTPVGPHSEELMAPRAVVARPSSAARLAAYGSVGRGPAPTFGARLGGELRVRRFAIGFELAVESTLGAAELGRDRASVLFVLVGPVACYRRPYLALCVPLHGGFAQGEAPGVVTPTPRRTLAGFLGIRAGIPLALGDHVELEPFVAFDAALVRTRFQVSLETVWTQAPVSGSLGLSLVAKP